MHIYLGPSVEGCICKPRRFPHRLITMNIVVPVAFWVSEPRLCAFVEMCVLLGGVIEQSAYTMPCAHRW